MKTTKMTTLGTLAAASLMLASCQTTPHGDNANAKRGAVGGALLGGALGGIIGHQSGRGLEGAAIGAGAGAIGGGVLGSAKDDENARRRAEAERYRQQQYYGQPPQPRSGYYQPVYR